MRCLNKNGIWKLFCKPMKIHCRPIGDNTLLYNKGPNNFFIPECRFAKLSSFNSGDNSFVYQILKDFIDIIKFLIQPWFYFFQMKHIDFMLIQELHKLQLR